VIPNPNDKTDYLVILANTLEDSDEIREEAISELNTPPPLRPPGEGAGG